MLLITSTFERVKLQRSVWIICSILLEVHWVVIKALWLNLFQRVEHILVPVDWLKLMISSGIK